MNPIKFDGVNVVYAEEQPEYLPLSANRARNGNIITCWELTDEEIQELIKTKKLWISMMTFNKALQPIMPSVYPLSHPADDYEEINFRDPATVTPELAEQLKFAYESVDQMLKKEEHTELLPMIDTLIRKNGAAATWQHFQFEQKLPDWVPVLKHAFEYLEYCAFKGITINPDGYVEKP